MALKVNAIGEQILHFAKTKETFSFGDIDPDILLQAGPATVKRALRNLVNENNLVAEGKGRRLVYRLSPGYEIVYPVDVETYFKKEIDERKIKEGYNHSLIAVLEEVHIFSSGEGDHLEQLQADYRENISRLNAAEYSKELERLAIDLSWKSSQIEGNTYSLLETERLLKEHEAAQGKSKDEAGMLLNHKEALDFIIGNPAYVTPLNTRVIEDIHSILIKDLGVDRNMRKHRVGISGTNYKPLDNEHQIREALEDMCRLVNRKENIFEKALLLLVLISYIQAFADGNKRTARIISNAILISNQYCPISFRTIDSVEYKKAMLIFYEQNNITAFKHIFISQFEFAVKTYF